MARRNRLSRTEISSAMQITWTVNEKEYRAEIPDSLSVYFDVLGVETAVKFIMHYGGTPFYLAANPSPRSEIAKVIGLENAVALSAAMLPGHVGRRPFAREFLCLYFRSLGYSHIRIARTLKVTDEAVRKCLQHPNKRKKSGDVSPAEPKRKRLISI